MSLIYHNRVSRVFAFLLISQAAPVFSQSRAFDSAAISIYKEVRALAFSPENIADVKDLTLTKDNTTFQFQQGRFYFSRPIAGKITGLVFLGEGLFEFTPPDKIERYQVRRFLEKDSLHEKFSAAYLRFTDNTADTLLAKLNVRSSVVPKEIAKLHESISKDFLEDLGFNFASRVTSDLLNEPKERYFLAVLQNVDATVILPNYFIYNFDPQDREEISVYQFYPHRALKPFYTISSFPRLAGRVEKDSLAAISREKDLINIDHYKLNVALEKNGKVQVAAEIGFVPRRDSLRFADFDLFRELKIDSVKAGEGTPLDFIRGNVM